MARGKPCHTATASPFGDASVYLEVLAQPKIRDASGHSCVWSAALLGFEFEAPSEPAPQGSCQDCHPPHSQRNDAIRPRVCMHVCRDWETRSRYILVNQEGLKRLDGASSRLPYAPEAQAALSSSTPPYTQWDCFHVPACSCTPHRPISLLTV